MPKNAIKREGRVNFWKNIDYKKPETRPEPVMSNPNPTRTRRNISKPDPTRTRKKFQNPNPTRTRHLATRPITNQPSIFYPKTFVMLRNYTRVGRIPDWILGLISDWILDRISDQIPDICEGRYSTMAGRPVSRCRVCPFSSGIGFDWWVLVKKLRSDCSYLTEGGMLSR